ncbi:MAG: 3-dehydroquinate synthase [Anaerovoracaceae bacterium]|nr:3-dehydroquinate synthase [Anaerovoracaceae bacterium]
MERIRINTSSPYDVVIESGALSQAGTLAFEITDTCKVCIVTDNVTHELFNDTVAGSFSDCGFDVYKITFPEGEMTKTLECLGTLLEYLADNGFTRSDMIIALGGGVIGDLAGFAAGTYMRGIKFIQIPTTLLAAVDSSVGGKTAVNLTAGKNLAGVFHQPSLVIYDPRTAESLTHDIFMDGLAEAAKSGMIADASLFEYILTADEPPFSEFVNRLVTGSIHVKADIVEQDEFDNGLRQLLNFGHTAGHAIERLSDFEVSHGRAVATGMLIASKAALVKEWSRDDCYSKIKTFMLRYGYDMECPYSAEELAAAAAVDKKHRGGTITVVIPLEVGECALMDIPDGELEDFFKAGL